MVLDKKEKLDGHTHGYASTKRKQPLAGCWNCRLIDASTAAACRVCRPKEIHFQQWSETV